jgi:ascorbate-specific PTS system EIIC-type component UlaA
MSDKGDKDHDRKLEGMYALRKAYYEKSNKQLLARLNLLSLAVNVALAAYTFFTINTDPTPGNECGVSLKWFLFLVLAMHATNILQAVCEITELKHCFCSGHKNFWMDFYEVITVLLMQVVLTTSDYCPGTGQYYICLLVNTVVYWLMLLSSIYIYFRTHCTNVSREECEKLLHGDEKAPHKD